jgi:signal transduction histidine kinase
MRVQEIRPGIFNATFSAHELSVLLAGARMSLSLMETDPAGTTERARSALESVLSEIDTALARAREEGPERAQ